jgi:hypothetical protein
LRFRIMASPSLSSQGLHRSARPSLCPALAPVPDQPIVFPVACPGDPVCLKEMDDHRRQDAVFVWSHFCTECRNEIVQGGMDGHRRGRRARWTGARGYWGLHRIGLSHHKGLRLPEAHHNHTLMSAFYKQSLCQAQRARKLCSFVHTARQRVASCDRGVSQLSQSTVLGIRIKENNTQTFVMSRQRAPV